MKTYSELAEGNSELDKGRYREAECHYREAASLLRESAVNGGLAARAKLCAALCAHSETLIKMAEYSQARLLLSEVLQMCSETAADEELLFLKSEALRLSATLSIELAQFKTAAPLIEEAYTLRVGLLGTDHLQTAKVLALKGNLLSRIGPNTEAQQCLEQSLTLIEKSEGKGQPESFEILMRLSRVFQDAADYPRSDWNRELASSVCNKHFSPDHPKRAEVLMLDAKANCRINRYTEAQSEIDEALKILKDSLKPNHPKTCDAMLLQAAVRAGFHSDFPVEPLYLILEMFESSLGTEHPHVARVLCVIAARLRVIQQKQEAFELLQRASTIMQKSYGAKHVRGCRCMSLLGMAYAELGQNELAEGLVRSAYEIRVQEFGLDHPEVAESLDFMARLLRSSRPEEAIELSRRSLEIRQLIYGPDSKQSLLAVLGMVQAYLCIGNHNECAKWTKRSLQIAESCYGLDVPRLHHYYAAQAAVSAVKGDWESAAEMHRKNLKLYEKNNNQRSDGYLKAVCGLAEALSKLGNDDEAEVLLQRQLESESNDNDSSRSTLIYSLAQLKLSQKNVEEAERLLMKVHEIRGVDSSKLLAVDELLYNILHEQKRYEEALPILTQVVELQEKTGANVINLLGRRARLARLHLHLGNHKEAEEIRNKIRSTRRASKIKTPELMTAMASELMNFNEFAEAEKLLTDLLVKAEQQHQRRLDIAYLLCKLGVCAEGQNQFPKAETLYRRALDISDTLMDKHDASAMLFANKLADIMRKTDRSDAADAMLAERKTSS
ncbi:MAG TPA: tetratricopeptide repeat protein [Planktothrix sp.]